MDSGTSAVTPLGCTQDNSILSYSNDFFDHPSSPPPERPALLGDLLADSKARFFSFGVSFLTAQGFSLSPLSTQTLLGRLLHHYGMK